MKRVIVIGGGASGLMAAYTAAVNGNEVLLIEKNEKLGKKIYITGKGRCNLTNDCAPDEFLQNIVRGEKFLTGAVYRFPPQRMMEFMEEQGIPIKTERGNRVFPMSDHASDVTKALERACKSAGVTVHLNETVLDIVVVHSTVSDVITNLNTYPCDHAIVCTGGVSYPATGSTGDGYRFAQLGGHTIISPMPSLVGINCADCGGMQGLSLKNVVLTARRNEKVIFSQLGEMLFTHYGISGPLVLTLSSVVNRLPVKELSLSIDLKPALDEGKLDARLVRDLTEQRNEQIKNVLRGLLPQGLVQETLRRVSVNGEKRANAVTREERGRIVRALKSFDLHLLSLRGIEEAVVTSGGVALGEIDPKRMESKKIAGLHFCGEVLDVDALTGGFNLHAAFATGFMAGSAIK